MSHLRKTAIRAILAITTLGLAADAAGNPALDYLRDRGYDLCDLFRVKVSSPRFARSLGFRARVTSLAQIGLLRHDGVSVGFDRRGVGRWVERRVEYGLGPFYTTRIMTERGVGNRFVHRDDPWSRFAERGITRREAIHRDNGRHHPLGVDIELHTGLLLGLEIGVYPAEAFDFALGLIGLDVWQDDLATVERAERRLDQAAESLRQWTLGSEATTGTTAFEAAPTADDGLTTGTEVSAPVDGADGADDAAESEPVTP